MNNNQIPLFDLDYGIEEEEAVIKVLKSKWLTMGEETERFEEEFAKYIGVKYATAVSNCTVALHLANLAVGVLPGDEVICPSLSFVATSNSILYARGIPVFADVSSMDDWTISPEDIEKKITKKTKAIMVMHYAGFSCNMDAIMKIASENNLKVIEDAAHSPGSLYKKKQLGSIGDISCFSFFSNKNISTGEGGMICTNNDDYAKKIKLWRSHGMTSSTLDRHKGHSFSYDVIEKGYNYRIDEIHSALGRVQLRKLKENNQKRFHAAEYYKKILSSIEEVKIPFEEYKHLPNYHIFPILLNKDIDRNGFMKFLSESGIQSSIHYRPVHTFSYYKQMMALQSLPLTEEIGQREVTLPMYPSISEEQIDRVVKAIKDCLRNKH